MRAAGLHDIATLLNSQAVLIRNRHPSNPTLVNLITSRIKGVIAASRYVLCNYNVERQNLSTVVKITPGRQAPTVSTLDSHDGWVAVSAMVESKDIARVMDELEGAGATDIIVFSMSNCRADRKRDLARLDEDSADLAFLQTNLDKMAGLTEKMVGMLGSFDDRLVNLEASILPIHKSTQRLTHLADNIDKTLKAVDNIVTYLDLVNKEERFITKGPDQENILPYLKAMARIKDALEYLEGKKLKACEKVMGQMVRYLGTIRMKDAEDLFLDTRQLLKAGMLHLETLFRKWLTAASEPIDPHVFVRDNDTPTMSSMYLQNLSQLSQYIFSSESEIGYAVDFTKPYIDIRSVFLVKTLQPMSQASMLIERNPGSHYERGSSGFLKYMDCAVKMFKAESNLAAKLLPNPTHRLVGFRGAIQPALTELVGMGRQINASIRRSGTHAEIFMLFDVLDEYGREIRELFDEVLRTAQKKEDEVQDLINAFSATAVRSFVEFLDEAKGKKDKDAALSTDGTVAEVASGTLNYLKRLLDWQDIVEVILLTLGDGNWSTTTLTGVPELLSLSAPARNPNAGPAIVKHYISDVLDTLVVTLTLRSKSYKRAALGSIFLLNNFNHIAKQLRSPSLSAAADEDMQAKFSKLVRKQIDNYQESWKPCVENLMDVTYVKGGALKTSLGNSDKQLIKEKFKNFNTEFEDMWRAQKSYAMPDAELRNQVLRGVKQVLLPLYSRFIDKYQSMDFTKNPAKYIKYDKDQLERMVNQFFEPSA
ncbi:Cullin repeat-like-containing domain protein [Jimgerdemannia flammicorona]|uniref:Exocyst complex protein EXO70 n=1 Tax=Jimgerdemannia flammicorona TaxID=994334 RepID=A0A433Q9L6_9FUNG|nr:Cullin repeat-like-containing domain protein [Jimgerdemannia flammicorona]